MSTQPQNREPYQEVFALPLVEIPENEALVSEKQALHIWRDLRAIDSTIPDRIKQQVDRVQAEVLPQLEQYATTSGKELFVVSTLDIHSMLSRIAIRAAAQEATDIGHVINENEAIRKIVEGETELSDGDGGQQPSDEPPNDRS